ncbi:MAG: aldehyde dehydrogenase family protein [Chitinivibrionales bacterium]|nr:aldehyde dehydrogenase family protein [Chitinivibrionales bacterium]
MKITTVNPATEQELHSYDSYSSDAVHEIVNSVDESFAVWGAQSIRERMACFSRAATHLRSNIDAYAGLITREMGKPIREARAEIEKCAWCCDTYAEHAASWLTDEKSLADGIEHRIVYRPLGVILAVMPWNYPFWQVFRCAVPVMSAGNTIVLKHASSVSGCALACENVFAAAGFPENSFRTVLADYQTVNDLLAGPVVQGLSLTGSTSAGMRLGEIAGKYMKKMVLELGGSDPFIVLPDADIDFCATAAVKGRFQNCGQSCIAAKRFIVHAGIVDEFADAFAHKAGELNVGNPLDEATDMGPLVNSTSLQEIQQQLADACSSGATVLTGGTRVGDRGFFFGPTVVKNVTRRMKIFTEEVFGPVAAIVPYNDLDEALDLANECEYGLGGSVWTRDLDKGRELALNIEAGAVFVNSITRSDPRMPLGGIKMSGVGRELAWFGLKEFTNIKGLNVYAHKA